MPGKPSLKERVGANAPANASASASANDSASGSQGGAANEPKPKSSLRKRVQASTPSSSSTSAPSSSEPLLKRLKRDWATGAMPSWKVQAYAEAAAEGGLDLGRLPQLATRGAHPQNAQRDLMRCWGQPAGAPQFYWASIPVMGSQGTAVAVRHPFVLPHELFASLHSARPDLFSSAVLGDSEDREKFWKHLGPIVAAHPRLSETGTDRSVPVGLHGDAGAMSKQEGLMVLTWNSLVGSGVTADTRFVITLIRKPQLPPDQSTLEAIYQIVAWSLNALQQGLSPSADPFGSPLTGGGQAFGSRLVGQLHTDQRRLAIFCCHFSIRPLA